MLETENGSEIQPRVMCLHMSISNLKKYGLYRSSTSISSFDECSKLMLRYYILPDVCLSVFLWGPWSKGVVWVVSHICRRFLKWSGISGKRFFFAQLWMRRELSKASVFPSPLCFSLFLQKAWNWLKSCLHITVYSVVFHVANSLTSTHYKLWYSWWIIPVFALQLE